MNLDQVSLDDKCERADSEVFLTSTQAHVKFATLQGICERQTELLYSWHNPLARAVVVSSNRLQRRQQLVRDHPQAVQRC